MKELDILNHFKGLQKTFGLGVDSKLQLCMNMKYLYLPHMDISNYK